MKGTPEHRLASGCIWMIVLAVVAWSGLGLIGGRGSSAHGVQVAAAASALDTTPPHSLGVLGGPNDDGWYNEESGYAWTAQDSESGIVSCHGGAIETTESAVPRTVYGTCTNGSGLTAPYVGFSYRFDGTPPTLEPVVTRSVVTRFGIVVATPRAHDALSGVAEQSCNGSRALSTRRAGRHTVTCIAHDRAGNFAIAKVSYVVVDHR
ncbi:hypothetical protein [Humibacillus xanthopallidus]|uniref:Uncharacterized protein n=1 Tax=Humibacillus xanthopallidus TaxID=412689 RepID=A0A543I2I3_9MICO|nr:hypothetical protein [Humibacillus xanthopallidus]TQM64751.1 hypothetical protein FBY41_1130 [Humibacillus xanthopallidus]